MLFMLTETGVVYDDGVVVRLNDNHFVVSCSTSHVAGVHSALEDWRQDRFDRKKIFIHNATPNWATLTVTGPRSRDLIEASGIKADLADTSLPHMAITDGYFGADPVRIARVSFTGDRSYEISIRADSAETLWAHLKQVGRDFDACLMGSEAQLLLRAEKGYLIVGKDTDGLTRPSDLGLDGPLKNKMVEFVGRRSLMMEAARRWRAAVRRARSDRWRRDAASGRPRCRTAFWPAPVDRLCDVELPEPDARQTDCTHGLIERGLSRMEIIDIRHFGTMRKARIVNPCFLDPKGERLHA